MQQQETIHAVMAPLDDEFIRSRIYTIRGVQVMLDRDLAILYGVDAKRINEQVKRNAERFPEDFMFRLTKDECLRSQIATLNMERGKHLKYMPYAFTESGVAMLSGVLRSTVAIDVNVRIMRAFVSMRRALSSIAPVLARVAETERLQLEEKAARLADQAKNDFRGDSPRRSYLGWWWMGKQMGAAIRPHSVLDAIPHDGFLTPFFFRIIGEGRRLPIPGIAEEDILMAGEGGDACCCYVAQKRLSNGNSTFYVWGLDILSDQPEAVALLNTLVDAD